MELAQFLDTPEETTFRDTVQHYVRWLEPSV